MKVLIRWKIDKRNKCSTKKCYANKLKKRKEKRRKQKKEKRNKILQMKPRLRKPFKGKMISLNKKIRKNKASNKP